MPRRSNAPYFTLTIHIDGFGSFKRQVRRHNKVEHVKQIVWELLRLSSLARDFIEIKLNERTLESQCTLEKYGTSELSENPRVVAFVSRWCWVDPYTLP